MLFIEIVTAVKIMQPFYDNLVTLLVREWCLYVNVAMYGYSELHRDSECTTMTAVVHW